MPCLTITINPHLFIASARSHSNSFWTFFLGRAPYGVSVAPHFEKFSHVPSSDNRPKFQPQPAKSRLRSRIPAGIFTRRLKLLSMRSGLSVFSGDSPKDITPLATAWSLELQKDGGDLRHHLHVRDRSQETGIVLRRSCYHYVVHYRRICIPCSLSTKTSPDADASVSPANPNDQQRRVRGKQAR